MNKSIVVTILGLVISVISCKQAVNVEEIEKVFDGNTYESNPIVWGDPSSNQFTKIIIEFNNDKIITTFKIYQNDSTCLDEDSYVINIIIDCNYSIKKIDNETYTIDKYINSINLEILKQWMVDWANANTMLEYNDWSLNVIKNIEGKEQSPGIIINSSGDLIMDLLKGTNNSFKKGITVPLTTSYLENRPLDVINDVIYNLQ